MDKAKSTNDGIYLTGIMLDFINTFDRKPANVNLEEFSDEIPSMVMQQLSSAVIEKQYMKKDCYIGNWAFAVYIRIRNADTKDRIDAGGCLSDLAEWFKNATLPDLSSINKNAISIEMTSSPHKSAVYEDKTEEWQVVFMLRYKNYGG